MYALDAFSPLDRLVANILDSPWMLVGALLLAALLLFGHANAPRRLPARPVTHIGRRRR